MSQYSNFIPTELATLGDFIHWAAHEFELKQLYYGHGTDNAWDEAVYLVLSALQLPLDSNKEILTQVLTAAEKQHVSHLLQRRINEQIPTAYLVHEAWFAGLSFYVDERVLIPRSPMAELIQHQFSPWIKAEKVTRILDLCTGSGCIAIACALEFPEAKVVATDISPDALAVATINVEKYQLQDRLQLIQSDVFAAIPQQLFDVIISNPPYVDAEDMADLPREYKHEPALGLAAGHDGLVIVKNILKNAKNYLSEHGILIVEVGNSEVALQEQFPYVPFVWLEFEHGEGGVFLLTKHQLEEMVYD